MNSILNRNIILFQKRLPLLYQAYEAEIERILKLEKPFELEQCSVSLSHSGHPTAQENGMMLHSSYNPETEAAKLREIPGLKEKEAFVFLAFGLGYGPISLAKLFPGKTLILIEPDMNRVLWSMQFLDFSPVFTRSALICLFGAAHNECIGVLERIGIQNCFILTRTQHTMHEQNYFTGLLELIERNKQKKEINDNTLEKFGRLWLKNSVANALLLDGLDTIQEVKDIFPSSRSFILAAGPTLEEVLPFLKEIKKKAVLICVDTALRSCLSAGVEPDFIILVDPQYWNARHIDGLSALNSILITEIAAYPSVFRFPCRRILLCSSLYPFGQYIEKHKGVFGNLAAGGSVATTAWDFAQWIGSNEIYFAGLDLSYPDKKTHVKGSTFEEKAVRTARRISTAETASAHALFSAPALYERNYEGNIVQTDSRMKLYAWWFESRCSSSSIQTFTVTKKSLVIPGILYTPLTEFLLLEDIKPVTVKLPAPPTKSSIRLIIENLQMAVAEAALQIHRGITLCSQAPKLLYDTDKQEKLLTELQEIDAYISSSEIKNTISLVFPGKRRLSEILEQNGLGENSEVTFLTSVQHSKVLYSELLNGLRFLQTLLNTYFSCKE